MAVIDDFDDDEERKRRAAASAPEFTAETIADNIWTAVYYGIPLGAGPDLLRHAHGAAMQCAAAVAGPPGLSMHAFEPMQGELGADKTREENFEHAVRRLDELDSRLRPAMLDDEAERQAAPEREPAAEKEPMTVEAIERDPWAAVDRDIPADASQELLSLVQQTAGQLTELAARELLRTAAPKEEQRWEELHDAALDRSAVAWDLLEAKALEREAAATEKEPAAEKEPMTVEAIERDPWAAVDRDIPADADRAFLATVAVAAEQCEKFAVAAGRVGEMLEPELVEFYQERRADAAERRDEAWRQFTVAPEQGAQTRLLNPEQLQDRAMSSLHAQAHEHREAAGQGAEITHEALDKNPWVVLTGSLSEFDDRELLDRIGETASDLKAEATQRSAGADSREEAELWKVVAGDAENRRREARETPGMATRDLPPDPEGMNDDRAEWAHSAIRQFQCATGTDWQDTLSDLLGDLMHFADRQGFSFDAELDRARMHYAAETMGEEEGVELTRPEPLTLEAIQRDRWNAVKLDLPDDANPELRAEVYWTAHWAEREAMERYEFADTREDAKHWLDLSIQAQRRMDQTNFLTGGDKSEIAPAPEPAAEKDQSNAEPLEREPLESALRKRDDFSFAAIEQAFAEADEISRPLGAAELAERVRRIIENPSLADAERDDRVLQVVEERREELSQAEAVKQDDAPQVDSSQEPETQSTAARDAAEVDWLFGREEMTEARAAAYDRWSGQELSASTGQSAGAVQEPGQSQSHSKGRSR
jgi:hypothetical protein